jgi:hypothetical protein
MWNFHKNAPFARKLEYLTKKKQNLILIDNVITMLRNVVTMILHWWQMRNFHKNAPFGNI